MRLVRRFPDPVGSTISSSGGLGALRDTYWSFWVRGDLRFGPRCGWDVDGAVDLLLVAFGLDVLLLRVCGDTGVSGRESRRARRSTRGERRSVLGLEVWVDLLWRREVLPEAPECLLRFVGTWAVERRRARSAVAASTVMKRWPLGLVLSLMQHMALYIHCLSETRLSVCG